MVFVQYRDNHSGAPRVLADVVRSAVGQGVRVHVLTSGGPGFLQGIPGARYHRIRSRFGQRTRLPGFVQFGAMQLEVSLRLVLLRLRGVRSGWFNTLFHPLPQLVAWFLFRQRVVHVHENLHGPAGMSFRWAARRSATDLVFVSRYTAGDFGSPGRARVHILPNFVEDIPDPSSPTERFSLRRVVLACALSRDKGILPFVALAGSLPDIRFRLALSADRASFDAAFPGLNPPENLELLLGETDPVLLFGDASVVANLSIPPRCVESFGLTVLEGFRWGIPAVVPPVGGIADLVRPGTDGLHADPTDPEALTRALQQILSNRDAYLSLSANARSRAREHSAGKFAEGVGRVLG